MTDKPLSTTREALMAELLIDVDRLLEKVSDLDRTLGETIEKSTKEAASKGYLAATLQLKRLTEDLEMTIEHALVKSQHIASKALTVSTSATKANHSLPQLSALGLLVVVMGSLIGQGIWHWLLG